MDEVRTIRGYTDALGEDDANPAAIAGRMRAAVEDEEPAVRALVTEANRWTRIQDRLDGLLSQVEPGRAVPPLAGVPVGIKDIVHVDGLPTRAGTDLPRDALAGEAGPVVGRLRGAGTVVLGKTVTTEFAYFDPGPTRNPHDPEHTPGGSSSGSAAAVAAGMCPLALGTQTAGSIIRPAAFCGVVGVKPSYDRVSLQGVLPLAQSLDHLGFMTPTVADARTAAGVIYDRWVPEPAGDRPVVGVPNGAYLAQATDEGRGAFARHRAALADAGYAVKAVPDALAEVEDLNQQHSRLMAAEAALAHQEWYADHGDRYSEVLGELIARGRHTDAGTLAEVRDGRHHCRAQLAATMDAQDIDLLVSPAAPGPAPAGLEDTGDPVMNVPWTYAGMPAVTLPVDRTDGGLPLGLQCVARFGDDERLLAWCAEIAQALGA